MELKFKSYLISLNKRYWTLTDDKIIYGKQEIPLSDIFDVLGTKKDARGLWFTFGVNVDKKYKLFSVSCWKSQQAEFTQAVDYICENYGTVRNNLGKLRKALEKGVDNMEPWERAAAVEYIDRSYEKGEIAFPKYVKAREKYSGKKMSEDDLRFARSIGGSNLGITNPRITNLQRSVDQAKANEATKTIIKDALIGGVVAGPAGAVVGAIVGKNQAESKK